MNRRDTLKLLAIAPLPLVAGCAVETGAESAVPQQAQGALTPSIRPAPPTEIDFFTDHELDTVRVLVDIIIPADERSGSATDAGVPEFIHFTVVDRPTLQTPVRGGLAWLDVQCQRRFNKTFVASTEAERLAVVEDIAWPEQADSSMAHGVAFFNRMRDLTAMGFFSSKMGVDDLQYMGNTFNYWDGAPQEWLDRLGVSYEEG